MATNKTVSSEIVLELIRLILQPSFKREQHEIDLVLPWLRKRSQLLQGQENSVLSDIVKNCTFISCSRDDVIIKQGDRGDCFYIVLRGTTSVFIDPKMTGESDDTASRTSAKKKKTKEKKSKPKAAESEDSVLSGMEKPITDDGESAITAMSAKQDRDSEEDDDDVDGENGNKKKRHSSNKALVPLDRNKYGKFIIEYGSGQAFGELALVHRESLRNASVIADEDTDLLVIDQDLFDRSLRAEQEAKYEEIRVFIEDHPFFNTMTTKFKKLLEMSLRKEHYVFDTNIIRQGDPVEGLHFLISGSANISIAPKKHQSQFMHLWPFEAGIDQLSIEFEHLREMRRAAILRKYEDPSVWETKPEDLIIRREQGYAAIEKRMKENHINLCSVQTREVLGDVEILCDLSTYIQTVRCTSNTTCFVLDTKNFERLVSKKNNPQTTDAMREHLKNKLHTRLGMRNADLIPFIGYLHQKLTEQSLPPTKKVEPFKMSKEPPDVEEEMQHLLQYFREGKEVVLIKPSVPGTVYYREIMRDKAKVRESQRRTSKGGDGIKLGSVYKARGQRKPRSMLQIRESLRQMMEEELIEMEAKNKKKTKRKTPRNTLSNDPQITSSRTSINSTPRTLVGMQNNASPTVTPMPNESKSQKNTKPSLMSALREAQKKDNKTTDSPDGAATPTGDANNNGAHLNKRLKANPNLPKSTPPVFVTEFAKNSNENLALPAISEENTQDEILLRANTKSNPQKEKDLAPITDRSGRSTARNISPRNPSQLDSDRSNVTEIKYTELPSIKTITGAKSGTDENSSKSVPILPAIMTKDGQSHASNMSLNEGEQTGRTDDTTSTSSSKWQTAVKFVNQRVQNRLTQAIMEEETSYKDYETSEPSMKLLEHRIQAFHVKYGMGSKTKNLPHLKRYKMDELSVKENTPKPGGKVWVRRQMCKFMDTEFVVKDHKHIRHQMVPSIPEFDRVQKSKVVVQQILKTADYGANDMF